MVALVDADVLRARRGDDRDRDRVRVRPAGRPARVDRVIARRGDRELEARRVGLRLRRGREVAAEVALAPGAALAPRARRLEAPRRAVVDDLVEAGPARGRGGGN